MVYDEENDSFDRQGSPEISIWGRSGTFTDDPSFEYFSIARWGVDSFGSRKNYLGYSVWGKITESRPSGSLSYEGWFSLDGYRRDDQDSGTGRSRYEGGVMLATDLDGSTFTGSFEGDRFLAAGETEWDSDVDFGLEIMDDRIETSGLLRDLTGSGILADFTGSLAGHFYGSAANEVGGTISGVDPERIFIGYFGGDKE